MASAIESHVQISDSREISNRTTRACGEDRECDLIDDAFAEGHRPLRELFPNLRLTPDAPHLRDLLSTRADHCLLSVGINDWDKLLDYSPEKLLRIRNMGLSTVREILAVLIDQLPNHASTHRPSERRTELSKRSLRDLYPGLKVADDAAFPIDQVTTRAGNSLVAAQILTWGDLLNMSAVQLLAFPNMGDLSVRSILEFVSDSSTIDESPVDLVLGGTLEETIARSFAAGQGIPLGKAKLNATLWRFPDADQHPDFANNSNEQSTI